MTHLRFLLVIGIVLLALSPGASHAAGPLNCDSPRPQIKQYHGTIVVHAGIPYPGCIVQILGGAVLHAGGGTAPQITGVKGTRAVFRVSGREIAFPGGVTIVVGASTDPRNAPETDNLTQPATLTLAAGTVLVRYDFATNSYTPVPDGRIQQALVTYKILRRGAAPLPQPAPHPAPATLPATGSGPLHAVPLVGGALLLLRHNRTRTRGRTRSRTQEQGRARRRGRAALLAGCAVLVAVFGVAGTLMQRQATAVGFGALSAAQGPAPRQGGASVAPTRLVIPALGIDTGMTALGVAGGAWQVPSYGAGYLAGSAWPGRAGNEAIAGHDDADGAVFRRLGDLRAGDEVRVYAGTRAYRYRVTALRVVPPTAVDVLRSTRGATLTLITCTPYLVDTNRLVARAELIQ